MSKTENKELSCCCDSRRYVIRSTMIVLRMTYGIATDNGL